MDASGTSTTYNASSFVLPGALDNDSGPMGFQGNGWSSVAIRIFSNDTMYVYQDGALQITATLSANSLNTAFGTTSCRVGQSYSSSGLLDGAGREWGVDRCRLLASIC